MIEIQADLHTHSDLSDGKGTLEENVEAAPLSRACAVAFDTP